MIITYVLLAAGLILQGLDVHSTNKALKVGGVEANPIIRFFMDVFGKLWFIPKVLLGGGPMIALAYIGITLNPLILGVPIVPIFLAFLVALYAFVVYRNFKIANK